MAGQRITMLKNIKQLNRCIDLRIRQGIQVPDSFYSELNARVWKYTKQYNQKPNIDNFEN